MTFSLLFWILMLLWAFFGIAPAWPTGATPAYRAFVGSLLLFILIGLLGWKVFGQPLHS